MTHHINIGTRLMGLFFFCLLVLSPAAQADLAQLAQSSNTPPKPVAANPVGDWKLDEGAGETAKNASSSEYHGVINGKPTWVLGVNKTALMLDGQDDHVELGDVLDQTKEITISIHAKFTKEKFMSLVCNLQNKTLDNGYCLHVGDANFQSSGQISFQIYRDNARQVVTTPIKLNDNQWHHIIASFGAKGISLSVDGQTTSEPKILPEIGTSPGSSLRFGQYSVGGYFFEGSLDQIRIFDRQVDEADVKATEPKNESEAIITSTTVGTGATGTVGSTTGSATTTSGGQTATSTTGSTTTTSTTGSTTTTTTTTTTAPNCNDENVCTDDSISTAGKCIHTSNELPCNDGNTCTTGDICSEGICTAGANPLICANDDNICTLALCRPEVGCVAENTQGQRSCYTGPAETQGHGLCKNGIETCNSGALGICVGEITPAGETCGDKLDNDCDGQVDEGCITCGNATKEEGEDCDEGTRNGEPGHCTQDCRLPDCSDKNSCNGEEFYDTAAKSCVAGVALQRPDINACQAIGECLPESGWQILDNPNLGELCEFPVNETCTLAGANVCDQATGALSCKPREEILVDFRPQDGTPDICPLCGNGIVDEILKEQCDEGAGARGPHQTCNKQCQLIDVPHCGDSVVNDAEACDEGRVNGTVGHCTQDCRLPDCSDKNSCNGEEFYDTAAKSCVAGVALQRPDINGCQAIGECLPESGWQIIDNPSLGELCEFPVGDHCTLAAILACDEATGQPICRPDEAMLTDIRPQDGTPDVCPACGDGVIDDVLNEQCDGEAGVNAQFSCNNQCQLVAIPFCGNGTANNGEECDEGVLNGNEGHCTRQCQQPECDDENICNGPETYIPSQGCMSGQPLARPEIRECQEFGACNPQTGWEVIDHCTLCGNGILESPEQCDIEDGIGQNQVCSASCYLVNLSVCGDGVVNPGEVCDSGASNGQLGFCNLICNGDTPMLCGDGLINQAFETCDDGNIVAGDGCTASCHSEGENPSISLPTCGDGNINQAFEECDDGNIVAGDGCTASCHSEGGNPSITLPTCGDGTINQAFEECDDGNIVAGDGCTASCQNEIETGKNGSDSFCGNGVVDGEEFCDAGEINNDEVVGACKTNCSGFVGEENPIAKTELPVCQSDIFDCDKTCSIESPYKTVHDVTTLFPNDYEKQMLIFSGSQNDSEGGLAFKAAREMSGNCQFNFNRCNLDVGPLTHIHQAQLDGTEINDAIGVSNNRYVSLLNLDQHLKFAEEGSCQMATTPLSETLGTERRWIAQGALPVLPPLAQAQNREVGEGVPNIGEVLNRERGDVQWVGHVNRILEITSATTTNNRTGYVFGGVEVNGDAPEQVVFSAIDIFTLNIEKGNEHHFIPLAKLPDGETLSMMTFDILKNSGDNDFLFNTYVTRDTPAGKRTDFYQCLLKSDERKCDLTETLEEEAPLVLVKPNTVRQRSHQAPDPSEEETRLFVSKTGAVHTVTHRVAQGARHAVATGQLQHGENPINPEIAEKARDAWFAVDAQNIIKPDNMEARVYSLTFTEDLLLSIQHLEAEKLTADAPLNNLRNSEERQYKNMQKLYEFKRNNFGGEDFVGFFDIISGAEKTGTLVSLYHNKNEAPTIEVKSELPENQTAVLTAFPKDLMEDPLVCRVALQDGKGFDLSKRAEIAGCHNIDGKGVQIRIRLDGLVSENVVINSNVAKSGDIFQPEIEWPLSGQVCAVDAGEMMACAPFSVSKSAASKQLEIPGAPAEGQIAEVSTSNPIQWAISGGGLACIQSIGGTATPLNKAEPILLVSLILLLFGWRFYRSPPAP